MHGFGVVVHQGRRSGRLYQTPVNVFATEDGYVLALTYGPDTDWVKNVLVAGGCELRTRGRAIRLASPRLFPAMTGPPRKDPGSTCYRDDCAPALVPAGRKRGVRLLLTFAMP
jgi:deazaflavin-dependent oxidoreductase (nitroreductase family)